MKKIKNYIILFFLLNIFAFLFMFSRNIKLSVLSSTELWLNNILPSMLPMYTILDLLINYGLGSFLYTIFKSNSILLLFISLVSGSPGNAKYIKEFLEDGFITTDTANLLLTFAYSPNPLFIIAIAGNIKTALAILGYIYITNFINYVVFKRKLPSLSSKSKVFKKVSFSECIESSIKKSFNILILILGIVVIYGILNTLLSTIHVDSIFLNSILEMTNALDIINDRSLNIFWLIFASTFAGLSIHTQIKSILENTDASYKYFFLGRIMASIPALILAYIY